MGESMKKIAIVLLAALMLLAISCDEKPQHEHKFSEEWKSNETQHWHECECQEKSGVADHDYETITVESTCSKKGSETVKCKVCGYVKSTKELELKAHTQAEEHVIVKATCSEFGSDSVVCSVCGEVISSTPIACIPHTWGDWVTDEESRLKTRTCSVCNATETSESVVLTPEVMAVAMAYDNLIETVSNDDMYGVMTIDKECRVLSLNNLLYDIKNLKSFNDGTCEYDVKSADEETYHKYSFKMDYEHGGGLLDVVIDDIKQGEEYVANTDPCIKAFYVFRSSNSPTNTYVDFKGVEVKNEDETYKMSFESNFDSSKDYETRYMKIKDEKEKVLLEYTLKLVGPRGGAESIANLVDWDEIVKAEAVGLFTVDGISYDIDSVNAVIANMFMPIV